MACTNYPSFDPSSSTITSQPHLNINPNIICGSPTHIPFFTIGLIGILLWSVLPFGVAVGLLMKNKKSVLLKHDDDDDGVVGRLSFLHFGYRKVYCCCWEGVVALR